MSEKTLSQLAREAAQFQRDKGVLGTPNLLDALAEENDSLREFIRLALPDGTGGMSDEDRVREIVDLLLGKRCLAILEKLLREAGG